jgi:hypothetical protein
MNTDERRALKMIREKTENVENQWVGAQFIDFLRETRQPHIFRTPQQLVVDFGEWLITPQHLAKKGKTN